MIMLDGDVFYEADGLVVTSILFTASLAFQNTPLGLIC